MRALVILDDEACRKNIRNTRACPDGPETIFLELTRDEAVRLATDCLLAELDLRIALREALQL